MKDFEDASIRRAGDATGGVTRVLHDLLEEPLVSLLDFGGNPNGVADNQPAFLAAAEYLFSKGGGTIWVPPINATGGSYKMFSSFDPSDCTNEGSPTAHKPLNIIGAGRGENGSLVSGAFAGGIFEQPYGGNQNFRMMYGLKIDNTDPLGSALVLAQNQTMIIEHCQISAKLFGFKGIGENYHTTFRNCDFPSNAGGHIGVYAGQTSIFDCRFTGWNSANVFNNAGVSTRDCSYEVNKTAIRLGLLLGGIFTASSSGTTLTVSAVHEGVVYTSGDFIFLLGDYTIPNNICTIASQVSGTPGGVGVYTTSIPTYCDDSIVMVFRSSALSGSHFSGHSFERNQTAIDIISVGGCQIDGSMISGTVAPGQNALAYGGSATWSSGSGGVVTVNTGIPHQQTGTFKVHIDVYPYELAAWQVANVTATVVDADTFTYPLAGSPGTTPYPGVEFTWSKNIGYGLRVRNAAGLMVSGLSVSINDVADACVDLFHDGNTSGNNTMVFSGVSAGGTTAGGGTYWISPPESERYKYKLVGCNHDWVFSFAYLPPVGVRRIGDDYVISDGRDAGGALPDMGEAVTQTGGSQNIRVMWNGTAWVRTG